MVLPRGNPSYVVEKDNGPEMFLIIRTRRELFRANGLDQSIDRTEAFVAMTNELNRDEAPRHE
jgi:hypothetical protein